MYDFKRVTQLTCDLW